MIAAVAGMLGWLLTHSSSSCEGRDKSQVHADAASYAMLPMLRALSSLGQQYSCTPCLLLLLLLLLVHVAGCALLLTCRVKQLKAM